MVRKRFWEARNGGARARVRSDTHRKLLIQLVGEEGVGQLAEVQFAQGAHAVDVLHVHVPGQVRNILTVELVPVGGGGARVRQDSSASDEQISAADFLNLDFKIKAKISK